MGLILQGRCGFEDLGTPLKGKNEWGVDTLIRRMHGARSLAAAYNATLRQGLGYQDYFLQSWEWDEHPQLATVTLFYKGFQQGGTPVPRKMSQIVPAVGSISASYTDENDGKGRIYKKIPLYDLSYGRPEAGIVFDQVIATRDIYTQGASIEFTYDAVQTVYRYISTGKPHAPRYFFVDIGRIPVVKQSRLSTADGSVYGKNAPAAFDDLEPEILNRVISFTSEEIVGTPYWECEDVVRRELGEGDSDDEGSFGE